jgi:CMP-N,N'-diacetyllegionaminic acid synthase
MSSSPPLRVLGLILARGGSKRLPGKNIRMLHGKPLIAWSIQAALACPAIGMTLVSTDAQDIADVALKFGAEVPFIRPQELAQDRSTSADAAIHAIDWLRHQRGLEFDVVLLLEPTSPLRAKCDLPSVLDLLARRWQEVDAVVSVGRVHLEQPDVMKAMDADGVLRSWLDADQRKPGGEVDALFPYGVAYAVKTAALRQSRSFYPPRVAGYRIERWQNYEVDDEVDFICIEAVMKQFEGKLA